MPPAPSSDLDAVDLSLPPDAGEAGGVARERGERLALALERARMGIEPEVGEEPLLARTIERDERWVAGAREGELWQWAVGAGEGAGWSRVLAARWSEPTERERHGLVASRQEHESEHARTAQLAGGATGAAIERCQRAVLERARELARERGRVWTALLDRVQGMADSSRRWTPERGAGVEDPRDLERLDRWIRGAGAGALVGVIEQSRSRWLLTRLWSGSPVAADPGWLAHDGRRLLDWRALPAWQMNPHLTGDSWRVVGAEAAADLVRAVRGELRRLGDEARGAIVLALAEHDGAIPPPEGWAEMAAVLGGSEGGRLRGDGAVLGALLEGRWPDAALHSALTAPGMSVTTLFAVAWGAERRERMDLLARIAESDDAAAVGEVVRALAADRERWALTPEIIVRFARHPDREVRMATMRLLGGGVERGGDGGERHR